jgi:hypothetical protein
MAKKRTVYKKNKTKLSSLIEEQTPIKNTTNEGTNSK